MDLSGKEIVIFDSNAYRHFTSGKPFSQVETDIKKVLELENDNNLISLINPIVLCELLAHLADPNDSAYDRCLKAVMALYLHNGDSKEFRTLVDPELMLCYSFFGKKIKSREDTVTGIGQIASAFAVNPTVDTTDQYKDKLEKIRDHVYQTEINFATDMQNAIRELDPSSTNWQIFANDPKKRGDYISYLRSETFPMHVGIGMMMRIYLLLVEHGLEIFDPSINLVPRAKQFAAQFNASIELYREVYMRLIGSDYNLFDNSRVNFIWDIHLMLSIGDQKIQNSQVNFVTHDKAILKAAEVTGHKYKILTLAEYLEYIRFS
ncbi:MAG: hypothetical protein HYU71_12475 [Bacteroidetes bacterium]|nr:hypothetical protein [Bacteroidota bacterium]